MIHLSVCCVRRLNYFDLRNSVTNLRTIYKFHAKKEGNSQLISFGNGENEGNVALTHDLTWIADVTPPVVKRSSMTNTVVVLTVERNQINSMML